MERAGRESQLMVLGEVVATQPMRFLVIYPCALMAVEPNKHFTFSTVMKLKKIFVTRHITVKTLQSKSLMAMDQPLTNMKTQFEFEHLVM